MIVLYNYNYGEFVIYNVGYKHRDYLIEECTIIAESIRIYNDFILWHIVEDDKLYVYIKKYADLNASPRIKAACKHIVYDRELYVFDSSDVFSVYNPDCNEYNVQHHYNSIQKSNDPLVSLVRMLNEPYEGNYVEHSRVILNEPYATVNGFWDIIVYITE